MGINNIQSVNFLVDRNSFPLIDKNFPKGVVKGQFCNFQGWIGILQRGIKLMVVRNFPKGQFFGG